MAARITTRSALDAWARSQGLDDHCLGEAFGCDRSTASRLRRGEGRCSLERALLIEVRTDGAVPATSLALAPADRQVLEGFLALRARRSRRLPKRG